MARLKQVLKIKAYLFIHNPYNSLTVMLDIIENQPKILAFRPSDFAEVRTDAITGNRSLFSKQNFAANSVICGFNWATVLEKPTYLSVQIGDNEHIELLPTFLECLNHHCAPNCFLDTTKKQLICLLPIQAGDEFTFFYPSAEWDMAQPFRCSCGSTHCIRLVRGAKYLPQSILTHYRFTDFIQQKLNQLNSNH